MLKSVTIYLFIKCFLTSSNLYKISKRINTSGTYDGITYLCTQSNESTQENAKLAESAYKAIEKFNYPIMQKKYETLTLERKNGSIMFDNQPAITTNLSSDIFVPCDNNLVEHENINSDLTVTIAQNATIRENNALEPNCKKSKKRKYNQDSTTPSSSINNSNTILSNELPVAHIDCLDTHIAYNKEIFNDEIVMKIHCLKINTPGTSFNQLLYSSQTYVLQPIDGYTSINVLFFQSTLFLLKNVIYYRFNIANFFYIFFSYVNKSDKNSSNNSTDIKNERMMDLIKKSIEFVDNTKNLIENEIIVAEEKDIDVLKHFERFMVKECIITANAALINNSKEYKLIKEYNKKYIRALSTSIKHSAFNYLYIFLHDTFHNNISIAKFYYSFNAFVRSLYDTNLIINKVLNTTTQNHFINIGAFEIHECACSFAIKQYFLFHWAFCWISYFSKYVHLPTSFSYDVDIQCTINSCPKEFFIQLILLVHIIINIEGDTVSLKDLDNYFIFTIKSIINNLLSTHLNGQKSTFLEATLSELFKSISHIANHKAYYSNSIYHTRILQTPKENYELSNRLVPILQNLLEKTFLLAKEAYSRANYMRMLKK